MLGGAQPLEGAPTRREEARALWAGAGFRAVLGSPGLWKNLALGAGHGPASSHSPVRMAL